MAFTSRGPGERGEAVRAGPAVTAQRGPSPDSVPGEAQPAGRAFGVAPWDLTGTERAKHRACV